MVPRRDAVIATLRQRFLSASHLGLLSPGDKLPSARDLARELGVDRRVVLAAYRYLEREGVIELRQRSGIYFAPAAAAGGRTAATPQDQRRLEWLVDVAADGVARGMPLPALADELHRHVSTLRLRAACVECNDDQIAALCATLRDEYGFEVAGVAIDPLRDVTASFPALFGGADENAAPSTAEPPYAVTPTDVPAALRRADVLVTTPFHASDVKFVAERLGKAWIAVGLRADVFAELARLLERGPAYAVVADPVFAHKLTLIYRATPGGTRFRALVAGRDDPREIPPGAPTLVTQLARERLAQLSQTTGPAATGPAALGREIAEPRALSAASARDLAAFVVRANAAALTARATGAVESSAA